MTEKDTLRDTPSAMRSTWEIEARAAARRAAIAEARAAIAALRRERGVAVVRRARRALSDLRAEVADAITARLVHDLSELLGDDALRAEL
jgi:hypothetical protein